MNEAACQRSGREDASVDGGCRASAHVKSWRGWLKVCSLNDNFFAVFLYSQLHANLATIHNSSWPSATVTLVGTYNNLLLYLNTM